MRIATIAAMSVLLGVGFTGAAQATLAVNTTTDANVLANAIAGSGITISNATFSTNTYGQGAGTFGGGNSAGVGFDNGILLTTGAATNAIGPNSSNFTTGSGSYSQLSFDFTSTTGSLFFSYVFASEEYTEFVNQGYNDSFSLLLDGVNIALLPGGDPVTIDNVNPGTNPAYYRDNAGGAFDIEYDGMTVVLTAAAIGLTAGTHHFDFVISDQGDANYDSGVFIKQGSFTSEQPPTDIPEPATLALLGMGLLGLGMARRRKA